jgi:ketosteroid isomerase-like protein
MDLEEIEAIKQLKARYFRLLDTKQWERWGDVFAEDAVLEHPANRPQPLSGRAEIVATVSAGLAGRVTVHHGHMPEIEITGERTAKGIWAMYDLLLKPLPDGNGEARYEGYGHYLERYTKGDDGRWRIAHLHLRRLHLEVEEHKRDLDLRAFEEWERS